MLKDEYAVLIINTGSSSVKFGLYNLDETPRLLLSGKIQKIGSSNADFSYKEAQGTPTEKKINAVNITEAVGYLTGWLADKIDFQKIAATGHRIVFGMNHLQPIIIDDKILKEFRSISIYDPDHLPGAIVMIEKIAELAPTLQQIACFDTSFHSTLPRVAQMIPLPRRFEKEGIKRFGFHGISYQYLLEKLSDLGGADLVNGNMILAHLGSGASMAAVKNGKCIDTSMGFTPAGGFMMGTRSGDLDPGVVSWMLQKDSMNAAEVDSIINHQSGLLGVSETSGDMSDLLHVEQTDERAAESIALFCYQVKKTLCAFAGVLGGIDTIVFTGGIGENAFQVRSRICTGLEFLGIQLDEKVNQQNESIISSSGSKVSVYVIPANEEYMIAKATIALLDLNKRYK